LTIMIVVVVRLLRLEEDTSLELAREMLGVKSEAASGLLK
jgi:hypothetical protein